MSCDAETGLSYLCFSAQDWWYFNRGHSDIQLMLRIARKRPVLFVNSIGMRMPLPGRSTEPLRRIMRKVASIAKFVRRPLPDIPNFHVMSPLILPFYGSPLGRFLNARLVRWQVSMVAKWLRMERAACIVTIPTAFEAVRGMDLARLVYNRSDNHSAFEEADCSYIRTLELTLLEQADRVLYVSSALLEEEADLTGERAVLFDHGVDLALFRRDEVAQEPPDLQAIPHPRLGFFGQLEDYTIDFDLIERLARSMPEAQVVLIGKTTSSLERFRDLPNVHWLGFRPYEEIPRYGAGFDVALMPWLVNDWIRHSNPIKLKEYLALGLPVVSTDFPEARRYGPAISVARDPDDFIVKVKEVLAGGGVMDAQSLRALAGATWEQRAEELIAMVEG